MLFPSVGRNDMKYSLFHKPLGGVEPKAAHAHSQLNTSLCNRAAGDEPTLNVTTPCNGRSYQEFILGVLLMCVNDGIHSQRTYGGANAMVDSCVREQRVCCCVYMQM